MASLCRLLLGLVLGFYGTHANPVVLAPWGQIQGVSKISANWSPFHAYYSIPYALPPVGNRRFQKPVEHPGVHKGVFNATIQGPSCRNGNNDSDFTFAAGFSEDCLTLDVFTPVIVSSTHAVIVYIHGGGFVNGGPRFPVGSLVSKDVVLVMIRYRLGPLGFLSTGDDASKGNYGLWDQHMALQWVHRNIRAFGGDPNRVTLMGESAGSASVAYQALYEGSKGLFQRTLMQSGAATSTWALNRNPVETTYEFAKKVGCTAARTDHLGIVNCLRAADVSTFPKASFPVDNDPLNAATNFYFVPTVDGEFVKQEPMTLMNSPKYLQDIGFTERDSMVAVNSNEGALFNGGLQLADLFLGSSLTSAVTNRTFYRDRLIPKLLNMYFGRSTSSMADAVERTYLNTSSANVDIQDVLDTYADPAVDVPVISFAAALSKLSTPKSNYLYLFDHTPTFPAIFARKGQGLDHGADQMYVFGLVDDIFNLYNLSHVSPDEKELSNLLIAFLTGYAKTGDPRPAVKQFTGLDWPEFTSSEQKYLDLKVNPEIRSHPYRKRFELWTKTLPEMLKKSNTGNSGSVPIVG